MAASLLPLLLVLMMVMTVELVAVITRIFI
jgi:hypothetical protein